MPHSCKHTDAVFFLQSRWNINKKGSNALKQFCFIFFTSFFFDANNLTVFNIIQQFNMNLKF